MTKEEFEEFKSLIAIGEEFNFDYKNDIMVINRFCQELETTTPKNLMDMKNSLKRPR
ncbi:hypothetical protein ACQKOF_13100 [Lysinibacillus sp. NPDC093190]|uniref:hypothetical protein n=1 Tax=Lysinibacillus sp. NPDC093190 TaxID=3390575 RepID=UPI003CFD1372